MATIASIAAEHHMQPHELRALTDLHNIADDQTPLDGDTEAFVRDVAENTDADGVYHAR